MRLTRIEGLPPSVSPVQLSASLAARVAGDAIVGTGAMTPGEADLDPRQQRHLSPAPQTPMPDGERAEARRLFVQADRLCQPADPRLIAFWCAKLSSLPFRPAQQAWVDAAIEAICIACAELPGVVWTNETLAEALRTFERWPSPAQVYALLEPKARPFWRTRDGLRRALEAPPPPVVPREPPTPGALEAVAGMVASITAEIRQGYRASRDLPKERPPVPVSAGALLATYERLAAQGDTSAAIRVAMLRKQLGEAGA
jgi:hypothetical protein